ncbi:hypothetical protein [Ensifer sp. MJa1]|uniref:hypothetical protein n=1 Tax=Ensifer sp. MJa1 TaxID=2919888 RepID=UPI00300BCBD2
MQKTLSALWKLFAAFLCVATPTGIVLMLSAEDGVDFLDVIGAILSVPGAIGVVCYAFDKTMLPAGFWPPFTKILGLWTALCVVIAVWEAIAIALNAGHWSELIALLFFVPLTLAITYFVWIGVRRYTERLTARPATPA